MKAHAVVFPAPREVEFREVSCPDPGPGDVVVRVTHSWISNGTEGSFLRGERIDGDTPRREDDPSPFPIVTGYQKVGVVEWTGAEIDDLAIGETVFVTTSRVEGLFRPFGGHVSPSVSPRDRVYKLPPGVDPVAFSGLVLTQVGYNCGVRAPLSVGDAAVVLGDGMVGLWTAQTLAWRGAEVLLIGRHDDRLKRFPEGPRSHRINSRNRDWVPRVEELFPNGVRVFVDTVGSVEAIECCFCSFMARYGHIVSAGFYGSADRIPLQPPRYGELSIDLVSGMTRERLEATRDLIAAGFLDTLSLITHRLPASEAPEAWKIINQKREHALGVILEW